MSPELALQRYVTLFERLTPTDLPLLLEHFSADARFVDPFNDVSGPAAIERIFAHMFEQLCEPRFVVHESALDGQVGLLIWTLYHRDSDGCQRQIRGASRVTFADSGLATSHEDFWDPAAQIYEQVPVLGGLMRWLRGRLSVG